MNDLESDKLLQKWLIRNYNRYFRSNCNDTGNIITDLHNKGFSDNRIIDFAKAENHLSGLVFI